MSLLKIISKKEEDIALKIEFTNASIARYITEYIENNDLHIDKGKLKFLFEKTIKMLNANILENFGTELQTIVPAVAEKNDIADTYYWRLP